MDSAPHPPPPRVPRAGWTSHRNYPGQVLLLGSHQAFRETSRRLIAAADDLRDPGHVGLPFSMWIAAMRSHERYEERKLYPYLESRYRVQLDELRTGHSDLHAAESDVRAALEGEGGPALVGALRAHDRVLDVHLRLEEDAVIPILLEMERDEFAHYVSSPIDTLLRGPRVEERRPA